MSYETLIHEMSDEIDKAERSREEYSLYSIIEKYFEKVSEDMRAKCIEVVKQYVPAQDYAGNHPTDDLVGEIKKL